MVIYNHGAKEIWRPRLVNSRRFQTAVLTFFIESMPFARCDNTLSIVVEGITQEEFDEKLTPFNLHMQKDYDIIVKSDVGTVLNLPGKVFVNGLFVCDYKPYRYGYTFNPGNIKLDRDRKLVSDFELQWLSSQVWIDPQFDHITRELIVSGAADVAYVPTYQKNNVKSMANDLYADFKAKYGPNAVPIADADAYVRKGYRGIVISNKAYFEMLIGADDFCLPDEDGIPPKDRLINWFTRLKQRTYVPTELQFEFDDIMREIE